MPRFNSTGIPDGDYLLGRGCLFISELDAMDRPKGYTAMGNGDEFKLSFTTEKLDHFKSCSAVRKKDKTVITSVDGKLAMKLDELTLQNIARFVYGEASNGTANPAVAGFASHVMVPAGTLALGAHYPIYNASYVRAMDVDPSKLTIATTNATPVSLVLNTDFTVDSANGTIFILSTSTVAADAIAASEGLTVELAADAGAAAKIETVKGLTQGAKNYALMFKGINAADNNREYVARVFKTQLGSTGDLALIQASAWSELNFDGDIQESNDPAAAAYGSYMSWEQPSLA